MEEINWKNKMDEINWKNKQWPLRVSGLACPQQGYDLFLHKNYHIIFKGRRDHIGKSFPVLNDESRGKN